MTADYQIHRLEWQGILIELRYCPSWADFFERIYGEPLAHLEIEAVALTRRCSDMAIPCEC